MLVRVRLGRGPNVHGKRAANRRIALAVSSLLAPASMTAFVLAAWRIAADLRWTSEFGIADGLFSHWQVWLVGAIALQVFATVLNRYGHRNDPAPQ
ncbi:MAG: hypothetical protein WD696_10940 [Bryobacteraceae bacterium]